MKRALVLRRETLAALDAPELAAVAGAQAITVQGLTCPLMWSCVAPMPSWDPPSCGCETYAC